MTKLEYYAHQCVRLQDGHTFIYCVECDAWRAVAVLSSATTKTNQDGSRTILDHNDEYCICTVCNMDIEYLLSVAQRVSIIVSTMLTNHYASR